MKKNILLAIGFALAPLWSVAQNLITGHITDVRTGEPLIGASVIVKSEKGQGVVTDYDGNFSLQTKVEAPLTLRVEYVGYRALDVDVYDFEEPVEIALIDNSNKLDEVVVVGYGVQKRKALTGAVTTVKNDELFQTSTSFDNILGGAVAGLDATSSSGQPGASINIRIRGGNSITGGNEPLYVIDGVLIYNSNSATNTGVSYADSNFNPLASINPSDIESIEVLKDVSASAIYGSRGANGVIIVTTKNGKRGRIKVDYGYSIGVSNVRKTLDLLNAEQWGNLYLDLATDAQKTATGVTPAVVSTWGAGTDWQDALFRTATTQQHQLSVSGGSETERFLISANYTDQGGVIRNTNFERLGARINYERDIFKNVTIGLKSNVSKSTQKGSYSFGSYSNGFSGILEQALRTSPAVPIYNTDGTYNYANPFEAGDFVRSGQTPNPIADLSEVDAETKVDNVLVSVFGSWEIIPGLRLRVQGSTDIINTRQNFFGPSTSTAGFNTEGYASIGSKRWESDQVEATLTWNKKWNKQEIEVLGGYTYQQEKSENVLAASANFANENLGYHSLQAGSQLITPQSNFVTSVLYSGIGRINYSLLDRYHLTATLRADGSSRFAKNKKWGWFPSLGFSWNVNEEKFLKSQKWIEDLKIRASIGTVGNQEIGDYRFLSTYAATHYYLGGGTKNAAYYRSGLGNDDLKWETTTSYDLGFDLSILKGKLNFVFDYYHKKTSDLLLSIPVEQTSGFSSQLSNVGNVTNDGVEFAANATLIQQKDLSWNASANIAHNKNKVTSLGTQQDEIINGNQTIIRVGEALGTYYGWVFDGVVQAGDDLGKVPAPSNKTNVEYGDAKFVDQNGDGVVDQANDRVVLGSAQPNFTYGFASQLRYKNWDLSFNFQGSYGNKLYNQLEQALESPNASYNASAKLANRWSETNPSTTVPRAYALNLYNSYLDSRFIEDASYLRLKNIQLGYNFKPRFQNGTKVGIYLYASAQNLLT
ncbi:MAG: TonB-dependent receptor, partial [Prevotella sp.]|nr:TonB-dependent receptor [Prevotella sp.]